MINAISPLGRLSPGGMDDTPSSTGAAGAATADFGASLAAAIRNGAAGTVQSLQGAEQVSLAVLQGADVSPREVVDAVMSAEQALQTTIAIRDKIVSAYLEISRMSI